MTEDGRYGAQGAANSPRSATAARLTHRGSR